MELSNVMVFPIGVWNTKKYGKLPLTQELADQVVENFNNNVLEREVFIDQNHDRDKATGWIKSLSAKKNAIYANIEWTPLGEKLLGEGIYRYFSAAISSHKDPVSGKTYKNVLVGGALTNTPVLAMPAISLSDDGSYEFVYCSELDIEAAEWTRAYINALPDSSFAFIESGGEKDGDGKTVPRSLRHLPYRDKSGAIDMPHLRNALQRLEQTDLSPAQKAAAKKVLDNHMKSVEIKNSETIRKEKAMINEETLRKLLNLSPEDDIETAVEKLVADAKSFKTETTALSEQVSELKKQIELADKADTTDGIRLSAQDLSELKAAAADGSKAKKDLHEMRKNNVINVALSDGKIEPKEKEKYMRDFDDLTAAFSIDRAEEFIKGLPIRIDLTERGASGGKGDTLTFSDVIDATRKENPKLSYVEAFTLAQKENPDLAKAHLGVV